MEVRDQAPRGQYAQDLIDALYVYTECQVILNSMIVVIKDNLPWEPTISEILHLNVESLQHYVKRELEIERDHLLERIFEKTLEQIFIENRLYKKIENISEYEKIHYTVAASLEPFHSQLSRVPTYEDRERLLNMPIRRISRFDLEKNQEEIAATQEQLAEVEKHLKSIKKYTIQYLRGLIKKFAKDYPRKTQIKTIEQIDLRAIETRTIKVGFDPSTGFVGTKVTGDNVFECTNFDKLLLLFKDGSYTVSNIPEKQYVHHDNAKVIYAGAADKKTVFSAVYRDPKTHLCYAKRFVIKQFILDKPYRFVDEGMDLQFISTQPQPIVELQLVPKVKQKVSKIDCDLSQVLVKGVSAKGIRLTPREVKKVLVKS